MALVEALNIPSETSNQSSEEKNKQKPRLDHDNKKRKANRNWLLIT